MILCCTGRLSTPVQRAALPTGFNDLFVEKRHEDEKNRASQRERAESRMQGEDHRDIDRCSGKIEGRTDAHNELAEGIEIAQRLAVTK
jgi:hypothetical protein